MSLKKIDKKIAWLEKTLVTLKKARHKLLTRESNILEITSDGQLKQSTCSHSFIPESSEIYDIDYYACKKCGVTKF
jgi:hypothetical protein